MRFFNLKLKMIAENKSDSNFTSKSYKISSAVYDKLNIVYDNKSSTVVLWNKYQIILYREDNLNEPYSWINTDFLVHTLIIINSYLICLDLTNNLHRTLIETYSSKKKQSKSCFQAFDTNIYGLTYENDVIYTLKYENNVTNLVIYNADSNFNKITEVKLHINTDLISNYELTKRCKIKCVHIKTIDELGVSSILLTQTSQNANTLVIMTFDSINLYGCVFDDQIDQEIELKTLYSTPSELSDVEIYKEDYIHVLLGMKCGVILKFNLLNNKLDKTIHLNGEMHRFIWYNDTIIYNDGLHIYRLNKNDNIDELPLYHIKDFTIANNKILAVSYHNVLYEFNITVNKSREEEYFSAEHVINNEDCIKKVFDLVKVNDSVIQEISKETNYITAFAIAQNETKELIADYEMEIHENLNSVRDLELTYCDNSEDYYNSTVFVIKVTLPKNQELNKILNSIVDKLKLNIIFSTKDEILKTITVPVQCPKSLNLALALNLNTKEIDVKIILLASIPGNNIEVPSILSIKQIKVGCENFVLTNKINNTKNLNVTDSVLDSAKTWYGNIVNITESSEIEKDWHLYIQLPTNYHDIFENINNYTVLSKDKAEYIRKKLSGLDFQKGGSLIKFDFGTDKVSLVIADSDYNKKVLKISSCNLDLAYSMKRFLSTLIHQRNNSEMLVPHKQYYIIENLQRSLNQLLEDNSNSEEIYEIAEKFQERVLSYLPF